MPDITIQFPYPINQSCQEGDILYYVPVLGGTTGGFVVSNDNADMVEMGPVKTITNIDNFLTLVYKLQFDNLILFVNF